jgi:uncharacterized 2Fe-2S/4Fe-4S cluster protein (DUF4445 family)
MKASFPLLDLELEIQEGVRVSDACRMAGAPLDLVCGGNGTCDKCRVDIVADGVRRSVLGCQHKVSEGMQILVSPERARHQLLESINEGDIDFTPLLRAVAIDRSAMATPMGSYDFLCMQEAIKGAAGIEVDVPDRVVLKAFSRAFRSEQPIINAVLHGNELIDVMASEKEAPLYGIAVDIGTTSVVAFLYDMTSGALLGHCSQINEQSAFGADVISRIEHTNRVEEGLLQEQRAIATTIEKLVERVCRRCCVDREFIYEAVYCGNSTMQHLFMGFSPKPLGRSPFVGVVSQEVRAPESDMSIGIAPQGVHAFMPLLGGFVGADTTACLLELPDDGKVRMMIDLGTNCEVALGDGERIMVASTACGPALEGAGLSAGMRATAGAIERVSFSQGRFAVDVIGGVEPQGFCGSGIIDMVALLLQEGVVNRKGAFVKGSKLEVHPLRNRIRESEDKGRYFVLVDESEYDGNREVSITLKDIRAIQLAKAAIATGCTILARQYGIKPADISEICLAGAFGNYIDIACAQAIGLIPCVEGVPVRSLGNGAGLGVQRFLRSAATRERAESIRRKTTHIELADNPDFTDVYLNSMAFGVNEMR